MCGEKAGGDDSLSGEFGLILTAKIWKPLGPESREANGSCTITCTHLMELERYVKICGQGPGNNRLQI